MTNLKRRYHWVEMRKSQSQSQGQGQGYGPANQPIAFSENRSTSREPMIKGTNRVKNGETVIYH